jgi:hypothetical protein
MTVVVKVTYFFLTLRATHSLRSGENGRYVRKVKAMYTATYCCKFTCNFRVPRISGIYFKELLFTSDLLISHFVKQNWCVFIAEHFVFKIYFGNIRRVREHVPTVKRRNIVMCKGKGFPCLMRHHTIKSRDMDSHIL